MPLNRFFAYLDRVLFLDINIWHFTYRSFLREYAGFFLLKVMLIHPIKTIRGLKKYRHFMKTQENIFPKYKRFLSIPNEKIFLDNIEKGEKAPLIGLGFCLKPYNPEDASSSCPSERANHDCLYLEKLQIQAICSTCAIYRIVRKSLKAGSRVYIMTSAKDIARDFLIPQIRSGKFSSAILFLCPYSVQAIIPPLLICGINMFLMAYNDGYCQNYQDWLSADRGVKEETTSLSKASWEKLLDLLSQLESHEHQYRRFKREGNIFYPY